jgi:hypothetical protein
MSGDFCPFMQHNPESQSGTLFSYGISNWPDIAQVISRWPLTRKTLDHSQASPSPVSILKCVLHAYSFTYVSPTVCNLIN